ncbi:hypothetical protein B2_36 [Stenotrophomonas phage B2]|nr:hypothetical protein B2_36 [Stenotrophomonas phage B2]
MNLFTQHSSSLSSRVVVLDSKTLAPIFDSSSPIRVSVLKEKRPTRFAVEDGTERSDHIVIEPVEITIDFLLSDDTRNAFQELKQAFDSNRLVSVQTKVDTVPNMIITALPREESGTLGSSVLCQIRFQEWREVQPEYGELPPAKVQKKSQSSTVKRGTVKGAEAAEENKSVAADLYDGWFK